MSRKPRPRTPVSRSIGTAAKPASCPTRRDQQPCAPLNQVLIGSEADGESYASCSCGRRYELSRTARARLVDFLGALVPLSTATDTPLTRAQDLNVEHNTWPADMTTPLSKRGVVPIGTPVLHAPTQPVAVLTPRLSKYGVHLIQVMRAAPGIGLASNQAGVPLRLFSHNYGKVVPEVLVNPEILHTHGTWDYAEGCLSVDIKGTRATVRRPRVIVVRAVLLDGRTVVVRADEILARVFQHEIDHLDGIEYVQRLTEPQLSSTYALIKEHGIDLSLIPERPYRG